MGHSYSSILLPCLVVETRLGAVVSGSYFAKLHLQDRIIFRALDGTEGLNSTFSNEQIDASFRGISEF